MMNKIKLEVPRSVNKCYVVHTDMAGGDSVAVYTWSFTCFMLHLEFHVWVIVQIKATHLLRVEFMPAFVLYPEAIIRRQLL